MTLAALEALDSLTTDALTSRLLACLLPETAPSAEAFSILAHRLHQVALHLQHKATETPQLPPAPTETDQHAALPAAVAVQEQSQRAAVTTAQHVSNPLNSRRKRRQLAKPFLIEAYQQRFVALEVFYLGWRYHGFASQCETEGTVEGHLFRAMRKAKLIGEEATWQQLNYSRCGRTDKGVSAAGQVVSLLLRSSGRTGEAAVGEEEEMDYSLKLNKELPHDIRVLAWCTVPAHFSARFSTAHREYTYYISQYGQLDIAAMRQAASHFIGEHDFRNFCKMDLEHVKSFRRTMLDFQVVDIQTAGTDGRALYALHVKGTAFLWHQAWGVQAKASFELLEWQ
ncbi:hypothetical protein ABBQ32_000396 [Trebouxia sp. C0010 RCD-2024]